MHASSNYRQLNISGEEKKLEIRHRHRDAGQTRSVWAEIIPQVQRNPISVLQGGEALLPKALSDDSFARVLAESQMGLKMEAAGPVSATCRDFQALYLFIYILRR